MHSISKSTSRQGGQLSESAFATRALEVYVLQREQNPVYRQYLQLTGRLDQQINDWRDIPCLPISFFRSHDLRTGKWEAETIFRSSGTTGALTSRHAIPSLSQYQQACTATFEGFFGKLENYQLLALLPSYLEREGSGLVAMVDAFMDKAASGSGFFLHDKSGLLKAIDTAFAKTQAVLLWGVTFALLEMIEEAEVVLPKGSLIMETGGMKGRGPELTRDQLHERLRAGFKLESGEPAAVHSEYGMTELQSQAYMLDYPWFEPASQLRVLARDVTDPFKILPPGKAGALNLYDLANEHTCAFMQSDDLGVVLADGRFSVLGRLDQSIIRGCNLLVV